MITLYTKAGCKYCNIIKKTFLENEVDYHEVNLSDKENRDKFITEYPGVQSVPFGTYENGKPVGGTGDYKQLLAEIVRMKGKDSEDS